MKRVDVCNMVCPKCGEVGDMVAEAKSPIYDEDAQFGVLNGHVTLLFNNPSIHDEAEFDEEQLFCRSCGEVVETSEAIEANPGLFK